MSNLSPRRPPAPDGSRLASVVVLLLLALNGAEARAQDGPGRFLPGTIIPNYDRIRIGQVEGLEGGAFVARTGDSGANWYNPAGLALADVTSLNTSSSAYEWTIIQLEGLNREFGGGRLSSLGTYFGGVLGGDVLDSDRLRLGFSVPRPVVWNPGSISGEATVSSDGAAERVDFYTSASMSTMLPSINAGLRLSDRVRIGGGIAMGITSVKTNQQIANQFVTSSQAQRASRSLTFDGQYWQMQFTAGAQWDLHERVRLGATLTSPGVGLGGSALLMSQASAGGPEGTQDVVFRDDGAAFAYELPGRAVAGVAVSLGRLEVEADVRYYGSRDRYEFLRSDVSAVLVTTDAAGTPTTGERETEPLTEVADPVTNLALGVNYPLPGSWQLHAGAFTDGSPVGDPETSSFGVVDLTGVSLAVSFGGSLSGSIGLSSSWGTTEEGTIGPTLTGAERRTAVSIRTFNLHYSLSYAFN